MNNYFNSLIKKLKYRQKKTFQFFIWFYIIGAAGVIINFTRPLFIILTPLALLLSSFILVVFQPSGFKLKHVLVYFIVFALSLGVEMYGVNTGIVFGSYVYGTGLGIKILGTPLLIGINWLLLIYLSSSVIYDKKWPQVLKIFCGVLIMLVYDIILEQAAPILDMWHWQNGIIPLKNYAAWFIIAFVLHTIISAFKINTQNSMSRVILIMQVIFFVLIIGFNQILP